MELKQAVALVTGANRGVGLAYVKRLQAAGVKKIYAAVRDPARFAVPGVEAVRLDVTRPDEVSEAARALGDVNLVINNAGILRPAPQLLSAAGAAALREQLDTNFFGTLAVAQAFAPVLRDNGGGVLVNVLSVLTWLSLPSAGAYGISKAAAWAATNAIRQELRAQNTLVVAVHAAYIDTDMSGHVSDVPKLSPDEVARQTLEAIEAGREEVLADDVTRRVKAGLAAEPAIYVTGPRNG
jgi:NAD(P)-dependent dehydrogenase (short-subunit alcohol dehydrogenase family)